MKNLLRLSFAVIFTALVGCATPQPPVPLDQQFYTAEDKKVGLMLEAPEAPDLALEGNIGLLDYAIIAAATSSLSEHFEKQNLNEFLAVAEELSSSLEKDGLTVVRLEVPEEAPKLAKFKDPDSKDQTYYASRDHRGLVAEHGVDYLLKLKATRAGLARPYYGFVPTDDPRAVFDVHGELIDLSTNELLWYANISQSAYATGEWDEGPNFPGLTNTYYVVMNKARQDVVNALARKSDIDNIALNEVEGNAAEEESSAAESEE
ncbi:hypothetical protein [Microbulbifer halophilus]|uniref:Lipoprotein n=1 Tax=Microbulbifer halophilus TaxID=453963 RepID=A0ABW5E8F4_9GAMM|nr:hypothetical protein [Microbulbifer halophilus]MCW8125433.1 hypothetical protein [Microbulbifer halophilus]